MKISRISIVSCLTLLLLTSCFSYKEVIAPKNHKFFPGEVYKVYVKKDSIIRMKVHIVTTTEIVGRVNQIDYSGEMDKRLGNRSIQTESINKLKKRKFSPLKTIGSIIGTWLCIFIMSNNMDKVTSNVPMVI